MKEAVCLLATVLFPFAASAAQVIGVSDGDTLTVLDDRKQVKIRLANIDAPEKAQPWGQRSKQALSDLCFRKEANYQVQTVDKYGRKVAVVTCSGVEANRAQVERGMAWVYDRYNQDETLPALQAAARSAHRGLWADRKPIPPWEFRHGKHQAPNQAKATCYTGPRGGHYRFVNGHKQYGC